MAITPTAVTIGDLFGNTKYLVDFYQREYKWNDSQQVYKPIKSLMDDIYYRFELSYNPNIDITEEAVSKYEWYYLNSIMTNSIGGKTYIVDGQQRLTTLTILSICLLKIGEKLDVNKGKKNYIESRICDYDTTGEIAFWMGFSDRVKALRSIYDLKFDKEVDIPDTASISEKNIAEAYKIIYKYLETKLSNEKIFDAFRMYLYKKVIVIKIDVDEPKDVAMAFEVINDRGIPLKAYEILKGKILGIIEKSEVDGYVNAWEESISPVADYYENYDDEADVFLSTFFQSKYSENIQGYRDLQKDRYHKTIYLDEYNKKIGFKNSGTTSGTSVKNVKNFVKTIIPFFGNLYMQMLKDCEDDTKNIYTWFNHINEQEYQVYLVFSTIEVNDPFVQDKYLLVTKLFDRMYAVLNLNGCYKSNEFANSLIELGIKIRDKNLSEIQSIFDSTILSIINKMQNRNNIRDFFTYSLFSTAEYRNFGKRFLRYYFARIDHLIGDESQLNTGEYSCLIRQAKGKDVYHIEHILANDDNGKNEALFNDEEEFIAQRNRLGGLVLLKGRDNQSSGNELYPEKLKTYVGNGTLFAQTLLFDFQHSNKGFQDFCKKNNLTFKTYKIFDGVSVEDRQQLLFELSKRIW